MPIRAVMFDIGGILEVIPEGGDPATRFPALDEEWNARLDLPAGHLTRCFEAIAADGAFGRCTYDEWCARFRASSGMSQADFDEYMAAFWDIYMGNPNEELIAYFRGLRPRYRTAILSNSFIGAREHEEARYGFTSMVDLAIYSHEEGVRKPDPRIFALASERLGIPPAEIIFLDDLPENVDAARARGFQAVLFTSTPRAIAEIEALLRG
ncbi:MAG TPA: HAD family phosphatase [Ktedonobacterales bacterium]|jgi:FMN phosphatase YigB (HAD superfamily)|nr:HAD family phosphatase [Ktedonobacterales bacterium]